ncbi:MAG: IS21 family transposase [Bacteroidetes bacterium]|nr:IS21 family transposase [Bacteroidota bacterium]
MANKPITMLQIRRIIQLKSLGRSNREIASELHMARDTVNGYVRQFVQLGKSFDDLFKLNDEELSSLVYKEPSSIKTDWRYTDLQKRISGLIDELQKPHVTRMILWEEYHRQIPEGYGYAHFCVHLSRHLQTRKAVMHFDHEPAASIMFDFAGDKISYVDPQTGEIFWCPVLVCVLPFSGFTYIEALPSASQKYLLKALNNALGYIGGVPQSAKTDNMKQVVRKSNRYEPAFEDLAQQWALHFGTTLMAARVAKPRDKASAESHVNAVYNRIYAPLRNMVFNNVAHINDGLWNELERFNDRNLQHHDYSRRDRFMLHEKTLLLPLPAEVFVPKSKVKAKVQRNYHITLGEDFHHYSVPFHHIGKTVQVIYDTDNVEIYLDTIRIASHTRNYQRNRYTTLEEHLPPDHKHFARIKGWNREYFIDKGNVIGPNTAMAITKILEQQIFIEQAYNSCLGVLRLGEKYGNERLEAASQRALSGYKVTYTILRNILERKLDQSTLHTDLLFSLPEHENIRGAESYQ